MTLQDRVIAKIKEYFPEIEVKTIVEPDEFNISYGIGEIKECAPQFEYVHKIINSDSVYYKVSKESAEEDMIKKLNCLKFYKSPEHVFIRAVGTNHDRDFTTRQDRWLSVARFSMGYKL